MSDEIAANINQIKFEVAMHWLKDHNCMDLMPRLRKLGFAITDTKGEIIASDSVDCGVCNEYATKELNSHNIRYASIDPNGLRYFCCFCSRSVGKILWLVNFVTFFV